MMDEFKKKIHQMELENESLPGKVCVQLASEIEHQLLPKSSPLIDGAEIAGWTVYSGMLGGDFFDYHDFRGVCCPSTTQMHIAVGDASGHGLCSSLLMTSIRAYLRARAMQPGDLSQIVADVNRLLCLDVGSSGHFVTVFYASIFGPERKIEWVRAGHDPALLYNPATDVFAPLQGKGVALGSRPLRRLPGQQPIRSPEGGHCSDWNRWSLGDRSGCRAHPLQRDDKGFGSEASA